MASSTMTYVSSTDTTITVNITRGTSYEAYRLYWGTTFKRVNYDGEHTLTGLDSGTSYTIVLKGESADGSTSQILKTITASTSGSSCNDTICPDGGCAEDNYTPCSQNAVTPCTYTPSTGTNIASININFGTSLTGVTALKWNQILDKILEIYKVFNPTTTLSTLKLTYAYGASNNTYVANYPMSSNIYYKPTSIDNNYIFYINDSAYTNYNRTIKYYLSGIQIGTQSIVSGYASSGKEISGVPDGDIVMIEVIDNLTQARLMAQSVGIATYFTVSYYNKVGSAINVLAQAVGSTRRIPTVSNQTSLISSSAIAVGNRYTDHFTGIITTLNDIISLVNDTSSS